MTQLNKARLPDSLKRPSACGRLCSFPGPTSDPGCEGINNIIDTHLDQANTPIKELKVLKHQLKNLQQTCTDNLTVENCSILNNLSHK